MTKLNFLNIKLTQDTINNTGKTHIGIDILQYLQTFISKSRNFTVLIKKRNTKLKRKV